MTVVESLPSVLGFDVASIVTAKAELLTVTVGTRDYSDLPTPEIEQFDFLPACDESGAILGVLEVQQLPEIEATGRELRIDDLETRFELVPLDSTLLQLLNALKPKGVTVVSGVEQFSGLDWIGLVTTADLNRHPVRASIYPLFAKLESDLAIWIEEAFDDPWSWLPSVPSQTRPALVGRWELDKRENIDTSPIVGCMFTDMLSIVGKHEKLWKRLGYKSDKNFREASKEFGNLRNSVMHPVRRLVNSTSDLEFLMETIEAIERFGQRVGTELEAIQTKRIGLTADPP